MPHRQVKLYKNRFRKVKQLEEEYESGTGYRRALLLSSDDVDRMAVESAKARFISHLVSKPVCDDYAPREFASYYRGPTSYLDPPYSVTSHRIGILPKIQQVIPAYPSLIQSPRWCPYQRPPSEENSETDCTMSQNFSCRCEHCTSPGCPAKLSFNNMKPCRFKDNIMTFCDRCTMTLKHNDAACGRTPIPSTPKCSDAFVPCVSSIIAVRDSKKNPKIHEMYSRNGPPVPILKKCLPGPFFDSQSPKLICDLPDQAVRDVEPTGTKSVKCFFKKGEDGTCTDFDGEVISRKNIYNEGISDVVTDKVPLCEKKKPLPPPECSKSSVTSKYYDSDEGNYIPHSHGSESKYHMNCKKPPKKQYICDDGTDRIRNHVMIPSPKIICKAYATRPCKRCKQTTRVIKLPKRVLTSERVVDACADKHARNKSPCRKK